MEEHTALPRDRADFLDVLNHADFVIRRHDRDQDRLIGDRFAQIVQIHESLVVYRQECDPESFFLEMLAGVEDCLVLGDRGDDVITFFPVHPGDTFDRQVIGLGRATRDDDLSCVRTDQRRDLFPGVLDGFFRFPAEFVIPACRIPELVGEERHHRVQHSRV